MRGLTGCFVTALRVRLDLAPLLRALNHNQPDEPFSKYICEGAPGKPHSARDLCTNPLDTARTRYHKARGFEAAPGNTWQNPLSVRVTEFKNGFKVKP